VQRISRSQRRARQLDRFADFIARRAPIDHNFGLHSAGASFAACWSVERGRSVLFRPAYQLQAADLAFFRWT